MTTRGSRTEIWDYVDLALLHLAKLRRRKLRADEDPGAFYEEFFNENDVQVMASGGDLRRHRRGEVLREAAWANMRPGAAVLDVGCGTGDNLRYVARDNATFTGLEYSEATAKMAARILGDRARVQTGSATQLPFGEASFDLVICIEVLEHIADDEKACDEIARVMKQDAALILSLPYRRWFPSYFETMGHIRHYTRTDVAALLDRHGLTVERYLPNFPRWSRFANYVYIACRIYVLPLRLVGKRRSPVEAKVPFGKRTIIEALFARIDPIRRSEQDQDYSRLETSTFLVARKKAKR